MTIEQNDITIEQKKSQKEKRQHLETLWWAGALIWAGLVFGADSLGLLPQIGQADAWNWVRDRAAPEDLICITGSTFIAAEMRRLFVEPIGT